MVASAMPPARGTPVVTPIHQRDRGLSDFPRARSLPEWAESCVSSCTLARPGAFQSIAPRARGRSRLPPTGVRSTVDVEHLSGYLACMREVQHGVNDIIDARNLSHRLQRPKKLFRIILVHWRVHDSGGYRVEPDPFLGVLDR